MRRLLLVVAALAALAVTNSCSDEDEPSSAEESTPSPTDTSEPTATASDDPDTPPKDGDNGNSGPGDGCKEAKGGRSSATQAYVYYVCSAAPSGVAPARFEVPESADPLTFAAQQLLDGPTAAMKRQGYWRAEAPGTEATVVRRGSAFVVDYKRSTIDLPILLEAGSTSALPWRKTLAAIDPDASVKFTVGGRDLCSFKNAPC